MSAYYTDKITLISKVEDNFGGSTDTTTNNVPCRVENEAKTYQSAEGTTLVSNCFIFISKKSVVKYGDEILITSIRGRVPTDSARKYTVKKVFENSGIGVGEFEVIV